MEPKALHILSTRATTEQHSHPEKCEFRNLSFHCNQVTIVTITSLRECCCHVTPDVHHWEELQSSSRAEPNNTGTWGPSHDTKLAPRVLLL